MRNLQDDPRWNTLDAFYESAQWVRVIEHGGSLLAEYPDEPEVIAFVGVAKLMVDDLEGGKNLLDKAIAIVPDSAFVLSAHAHYWFEKAEYERSLAFADKAIAVDPETAEYWLSRGWSLNQLGMYAEAVECANRTLALDPENANARLLVAASTGEGGSRDGKNVVTTNKSKLGSLREALEKEPEDDMALNNLGVFYANSLKNAEEAERLFRDALVRDPEQEHYQQNLRALVIRRDPWVRFLSVPLVFIPHPGQICHWPRILLLAGWPLLPLGILNGWRTSANVVSYIFCSCLVLLPFRQLYLAKVHSLRRIAVLKPGDRHPSTSSIVVMLVSLSLITTATVWLVAKVPAGPKLWMLGSASLVYFVVRAFFRKPA